MRRRPGRPARFARHPRRVRLLGGAAIVLATVGALVAGGACGSGGSSGSSSGGSGSSGSGSGGSGAAPLAAEPEGPTGEFVHAIDRKTTQGFGRGDLAVGGGWIYWIERSRGGSAVVRRKPAARPAAEPEAIASPGAVSAIAADAERLYLAGDELAARPHAGGAAAPAPLAAGAWLEIVPGARHLLVRSRDQVALVPRSGGAAETVWTGKHSKLSVDTDGDGFVAIPVSPWSTQRSTARAITFYAPGAPPAVIAELPDARGDLSVDGGWIYVGGRAADEAVGAPLWRLPRAGGSPERVGDPAWGFGDFTVRKGVLYGMVATGGAWKLQKLALAPGGRPTVLDARVPRALQALATDETHVYYLTDSEVRRAPR
jgi:hypothetical protein